MWVLKEVFLLGSLKLVHAVLFAQDGNLDARLG